MDVAFATEKLAKVMNSDSKLSQTYGADMAKQIRKRLDDLDAATTLDDLRTLPGRCEELTGDARDSSPFASLRTTDSFSDPITIRDRRRKMAAWTGPR
ncbi:MAG: hypothetical protein UZ18_ATM001001336 [Armatimonadetes bacterium OLB18]|nr:MAG: hypothetical protein UZ18_ATM001001336 [Armatimonadetes bacterium OLB18]